MTTATKKKSNTIPQRTDIEGKYTWNLGDIYKTENDWETNFKKAQALIEKAKEFTGKLNSSPQIMYDCFKTRSDLSMICANLYQYARLNQDLDNRNSKYQALTDRTAMLQSSAGAAFAFVEPELLKLDDATLRDMSSKFPKTDEYDFYIEELIRSRKHVRSAEVEEVLAQSSMMARGAESAFTMLDDADIKYPIIKDEDGSEIQLTKQRYSKILESSSQRVRCDANDSFIGVYKDHINTLGAMLSAAINRDMFFARTRNFESVLHQALDAHNISVSVYHQLIETTESDLTGFHKWIGLRKKILKLKELYPYDIYNPLFPEQNYEVPFEEAVTEVLEAVKPLGEKYCAALKKAFDMRWVDVFETEGKGSGAYSWPNYSVHPYVLMNYNDTIDNMFTLAHEMGHAMHSWLSNMVQPFPKHQYSIFVAEVASTLNEGLMLQHLLKKATDPKQKLFLLNRHINNTLGTFFHQVMYGHFELDIHTMVEKGEALSPDTLNKLWEDLTGKFYGPAMTIDEYAKYKWSRIPHFYYTYYVYQYATSYAASQAILEKFIAGEAGIVGKYLELISSGGNDHPINQLKKCGVDMTTPDPVKATLKLFAEQVDEVERLAGI